MGILRKLAIMVLLATFVPGCGREGSQYDGGPPGARIARPGDGFTVSRTSCVKTELFTKYKFIVISYPNGDRDIYCGVEGADGIRDRKRYLSANHYDALHSKCVIEQDWDEYWTFEQQGGAPQVSWYGLDDPLDSQTDAPLSRRIYFQSCKSAEFEDEYWYESYYDFEERLL